MTTQRELSAAAENSLAAFVTNALPEGSKEKDDNGHTVNRLSFVNH